MDSNMYASLLGCYWFHVICFFMLHDVVKLEVWISFQPAFDCMWSSLCREARCCKLNGYHLGWSMTSFQLLLKCVWNVLHTYVALLKLRIAPRVPLLRSGLCWISDSCLLVAERCVLCHMELWQLCSPGSMVWAWKVVSRFLTSK